MLDGELSGVRRRVVVTVTDGGPGPAYPFAGLLPVGFTVRLTQRAP
ncbi:hypothetical protein [Dactylosporangium sp. NPDC049140]